VAWHSDYDGGKREVAKGLLGLAVCIQSKQIAYREEEEGKWVHGGLHRKRKTCN